MSIDVWTMRCRLARNVSPGMPPESLVPNMMIATDGFATRYSQASGVSPARHVPPGASAGLSTLSAPQLLCAAIDPAANGFAPTPLGPEKKLIAVPRWPYSPRL